MAEIFCRYSQAQRHNFRQEFLVLDVDLSPLPASRKAEGSERGYMGSSLQDEGAVRAAQ